MKIALLLSGGVDSSVALAELKAQGHDVTAFYLKIWLEDELAFLGKCPWEEELEVVKAVCQRLGVPYEVVPLQREYWDRVVHTTLEEVKRGRTPNPDILCNQAIKFGAFYDKIDRAYEKVATGHYAQVEEKNNIFLLKTSPDLIKDQTYFLSRLSQSQLSRALFPIGQYTKVQVRVLAKTRDLPNQNRKDSQGLCFLGKIRFREFLRYHLGEKKGPLIELETRKKVGEHDGFWTYTIGQRQGLGLSGGPWFVVKKDPLENVVYLSRNPASLEDRGSTLQVEDLHWISDYKPALNRKTSLDVKVRHGAMRYSAEVKFSKEKAAVKLGQKDLGLAPGQFTVFYDGNVCLGSGVNG
jgi:tRNA-specific 2-thiouridylase